MTKNFMQIKYIIIAFSILAVVAFLWWQNNGIVTSEVHYNNSKIPIEFKGFKIVHISDLHNKKFGKNQMRLLKKIEKACPDIIVVTGDLIDRRRYNLETSMVFIDGAMKIAPVYFVSGNHEAWSGKYETIKSELIKSGVEVLDDSKVELVRDYEVIEILGLSDPGFFTGSHMDTTNSKVVGKTLKAISDDSNFQILLSHRPELFNIYIDENIDITFSGHAHGGQFRIPFIGGLFAPNQGFFPKHTSGVYKEEQSTLVVSRGLGNSVIPIRLFNRPEIIVVTLEN